MPVFVISKPLADGAARDVVLESVTLDRWRADLPHALRAIGAEVIGTAANGMGLALLVARPGGDATDAVSDGAAIGRRRPTCAPSRSAPTRTDSTPRRCAAGELRLIGRAMTSHSRRSGLSRARRSWRSTPTCPARAGSPGWRRSTSCRPNESPLGPSPKAIEAVPRVALAVSQLYPDGCVDGAARGDRPPLRARPGANHLRQRLGRVAGAARRMSFCAPATKASTASTGFSNIRSAFARPAAMPVVAEETDKTASVDAMLAKVSRANQDCLSRQSEQPDRHLSSVLRGQAAARRPAGARAAGDRRGLRRIRHAQRLRRRHRARLDVRQRRDDADLLEDPRPRELADRLGLWAGACGRRAQPRARAVQPQRPGASPRASPASRTSAISKAAIAHNARWLPWLAEAITALGIEVTPSVGNFLLLRFPTERGRTAADADAFLSARGFILRAVAAYGLPECLRLTVGGEEANRGVVAALADFMRGESWLSGSGRRSPSRSSTSSRSSASD